MEKINLGKLTLYYSIISVLVILSFLFMYLINSYTGYIVIDSNAGTISRVTVTYREETVSWAGFYGLVFNVAGFYDLMYESTGPGEVKQKILVFDCLENSNAKIYASPYDIDAIGFDNVRAGTIEMVDQYLGYTGSEYDSAGKTFNTNTSFVVNGVNITNVPTVYTKQMGQSNNYFYDMGVLNFSGYLVFVSHKTEFNFSYRNVTSNYQMIVPSPNSSTYYFTRDPLVQCDIGPGQNVTSNGVLTGKVYENGTNLTLANVSISLNGKIGYTDSLGEYNITVLGGTHSFFALKQDYEGYTDSAVTVAESTITTYNFNMTKSVNISDRVMLQNGTLQGYTIDNYTSNMLGNTTVSINGKLQITNISGFFNFTLQEGNHNIFAVKSGYSNYLGNATINASKITNINLSLTKLQGRIYGNVTNNVTGAAIENVKILISSLILYTNSTGQYESNIDIGNHIIIANKTGYITHFSQIEVYPDSIIKYDIRLIPESGMLKGYVRDNTSNMSIANATIQIYGLINYSNQSGNFSMDVPRGNHVVLVSKEGYGYIARSIYIFEGVDNNYIFDLEPLYGTVSGFTFDNDTNQILPNTSIVFNGVQNISNGSGFYNQTLQIGAHNIVGMKVGYYNLGKNINISPGKETKVNISLRKSREERLMGSLRGIVYDNSTNTTLINVTIAVNGIINFTNSSGRFGNISLLEGTYYLFASKSNYDNYITSVTINPNSETFLNISLNPVIEKVIKPHGSQPLKEKTIIKNVTANISENFDFNELYLNLSLTLNISQDSVVVNSYIYGNLPTKLYGMNNETLLIPNNPTFDHVDRFFHIISNVSEEYISNVTYEIGYNDSDLPKFFNESYLQIYYYNPITERWEPQKNATIDSYRNKIIFSNNHLSLYTIGIGTGKIIGIIKNNSTLEGISNASIFAGGYQDESELNGNYTLNVYSGTHKIMAIKEGYKSYNNTISVGLNETIELNISLEESLTESLIIQQNGTIQGYVKNSVNQLLDNVTIGVGGSFYFTNVSGFYNVNLSPKSYIIVAFKNGYNVYFSNINISESEITEHNITLNTSINPNTFTGTGTGTGVDVGPGEIKKIVQILVQQQQVLKKTGAELEISIKNIIKKLRKGMFIETPLVISNHGEAPMEFNFMIEGDAKDIVSLDKKTMFVEKTKSETLSITVIGNKDPGVYTGKLLITGSSEQEIPIHILIFEEKKMTVESLLLRIYLSKYNLNIGSSLKYRIDLQNLLHDEEYPIKLSYYLEEANTKKRFELGNDNILLRTAKSLLKNIDLPKEVNKGEYKFIVEANYLELTSQYSTPLTIEEPLYKYAILGFIPLWLLLAIVLITSMSTLTIYFQKNQSKKKKRYISEVNISDLPKKDPRSAYVGKLAERNNEVYLDLDKFQIHTLIAGSSGSGKTVAAQVLVEEALMKGVAVVVFDPSESWTGFLRKCQEKEMLNLYPQFKLKPNQARSFDGNISILENTDETINFKKLMIPGQINIFITNRLNTEQNEMYIMETIKEVFNANLEESPQLKYLIVYDGVHTLLPKYGGSGKVFVQIERATREFRKWGVGIILLSQVVTDFPPEVKANINTEIILRTRDERDLNRIKEEYGEDTLKSLVKAGLGTAMIENSAYNNGKPFFVTFRPILHATKRLSKDELEKYGKYNKIIEKIDYELEYLDEKGIDSFDLKLELKLTKDKLKSGNFNMVNIYLDSLKPRINSNLDKFGGEDMVYKIIMEKYKKKVNKEDNKIDVNFGKVDVNKKHSIDNKEENDFNKTPNKKPEVDLITKSEGIEKNEKKIEDTYTKKIDSLILKSRMLIKNQDKNELVKCYDEMHNVYHFLPKKLKKEYLPYCLEIYNKIK